MFICSFRRKLACIKAKVSRWTKATNTKNWNDIESAFLAEAAELERIQRSLLMRHESDATKMFDAALRDLERRVESIRTTQTRTTQNESFKIPESATKATHADSDLID